ncbi:hypothetical protein MC7420_4168 [Coleofasciculus chthonoplastes PCC 7420]|uniref:Uncharacterized protein n=1 Tax=Coleofasciculus chthonoplastes PCC 7420 TaxID=118168 RepID=B4VUY0_9CYAN|nr:hypothetical protein MC7420_4168 [Coleofasciculus chthonoplastes PCC 7420]
MRSRFFSCAIAFDLQAFWTHVSNRTHVGAPLRSLLCICWADFAD